MATDLGKAYVQIVPSAQGITGTITKAISGESASAGKSAGLNIVGAMKKVIIAAGIGKAIMASMKEGAALQQSLGGVQTLFKDSADTVIKNAQNAYKTAGLSANQYMETVTSFSASLLQSLGGDTNKAASVADMALQDMSDNANKFGTSMESIQFAYKGFAKSNYTMLDNLSLGYGGTRGEMERLLKDATKLTGVKYDISNLSDVYTAINVIQTELGITGTTAKEASATFTGSFNAMQAAAKNVLGSLAIGENVSESMTALAQTTSIFIFNNFIPMLGTIIKSLPTLITTFFQTGIPLFIQNGQTLISSLSTGIIQGIPVVYNAIMSAIDNVKLYITNELPNLLNKGIEMVNSLVDGIISNLPSIIVGAGNIISGLLGTIGQALPMILQAGWDILQNLVTGIINNLPAIVGAIYNMITNIVTTIGNNLPTIYQKGIEILGQIAAGLINAIPQLLSKIPGIFENIKGEFTKHNWLSIGSNIISGIADGIWGGIGKIAEAAKNAAKSAFEAAAEFLQIKSPSRKFGYLGDMSVSGYVNSFVKGIKSSATKVRNAMNSITNVATKSVESELSLNVTRGNSSLNGMNTPNNINGGYNQTVNVYSPTQLNPSEVARQTRNATRNMALNLNVG